MGLQARLMSQALRKLAGAINRSNCAVVFINQLREKIGVMFGNPETTTGGKALKFYASLRLDIRRIGPVKEREDIIGSHVRVKVVKNKVAPPFKQAEFDIMFDEGISTPSLLVDIASEAGIIQKSGAWYSYGDQRIGQGRENAKLFLKDNPALMAEIEAKVKESLGIARWRPVPARRTRTTASDHPRPGPRSRDGPGAPGSWSGADRRGPCPPMWSIGLGLHEGQPLSGRQWLEPRCRRRGRGCRSVRHCARWNGARTARDGARPQARTERSCAKAAVASALARLSHLGLLDDLGFARAYIAARGARGRGPDALRRD